MPGTFGSFPSFLQVAPPLPGPAAPEMPAHAPLAESPPRAPVFRKSRSPGLQDLHLAREQRSFSAFERRNLPSRQVLASSNSSCFTSTGPGTATGWSCCVASAFRKGAVPCPWPFPSISVLPTSGKNKSGQARQGPARRPPAGRFSALGHGRCRTCS